MYDQELEKSKIRELLTSSSHGELTYTQEENFKRAISLALDEVNDFENLFNKFVTDVSHLEVFQESIKEPLTKDMSKMIQNLKYLIEKNYTKEERENMPEDVLRQVSATQEKRVSLLRRVARRYLSRPKSD